MQNVQAEAVRCGKLTPEDIAERDEYVAVDASRGYATRNSYEGPIISPSTGRLTLTCGCRGFYDGDEVSVISHRRTKKYGWGYHFGFCCYECSSELRHAIDTRERY